MYLAIGTIKGILAIRGTGSASILQIAQLGTEQRAMVHVRETSPQVMAVNHLSVTAIPSAARGVVEEEGLWCFSYSK